MATPVLIGGDKNQPAVGEVTQAELDQAIADLIDTAPGTLDTLNELAAALADDPNFATTMTNALAGKADAADLLVVAKREVAAGTDVTAGDEGSYIVVDSAGAATVAVKANATQALPAGAVVGVVQAGAGVVTIDADAGVLLNDVSGGSVALAGAFATAALWQRAVDDWVVVVGAPAVVA